MADVDEIDLTNLPTDVESLQVLGCFEILLPLKIYNEY
jgi:hypothetical protein